MSELDEILQNYLDGTYLEVKKGQVQLVSNEKNILKAKQAIIELIGEDIIGEDEATELCHDDRELDERYARNFVRYIQRQKLQKLKE